MFSLETTHALRNAVNLALFTSFLCAVSISRPILGAQRYKNAEGGAKVTQKHKQSRRARKTEKKNRNRRKRRFQCDENVDLEYGDLLTRLKREPSIPKPRYRHGYRDLTIFTPHNGERIRLFPYRKHGTIKQSALRRVKHLFRDKRSGAEHGIHPRLVKLLYNLADHFDARQITVVSAYRAKGASRNQPLIAKKRSAHNRMQTSARLGTHDEWRKKQPVDWKIDDWGAGDERLHAKGRAVDFFLPGIPLEELAKQAKKLGHVGVGYYASAYYIHLDVRNGPSAFWNDRAAPGKVRCYRQVQKKKARMYDRQWKKKHDEPKRHDPSYAPQRQKQPATTLSNGLKRQAPI